MEKEPEMIKQIGTDATNVEDENLRKLFQDGCVIDVFEGRRVDATLDKVAIEGFANLRTSDTVIGVVS